MVCQGYFPVVGGAERQLASLAPRLAARGVDIRVYTRRAEDWPRSEVIDGIPVHRQPVPSSKALRSLAFTLGTLRAMHRDGVDIIHAHDLFSPTTTALLARRWLEVPVVVKVVRGGELGDIAWLRRRRFGARRLAWIRARVDRFVCISDEINRELDALGVEPQRRVPIPNGVDAQRFRPAHAGERIELRRELGIAADPVVAFTGRLAEEKRLASLVEMWPAIRARSPRAGLLLVGSGDQREQLQRRAGAGVQIVGPVDDVAPWLRAADAFALPSVAEGLSNALLEAMATGLGCVATRVGGAQELIEDGRSGLLVAAGDDSALQDALVRLLTDTELRAAIGTAARERVVADFGLEQVAERLVALYHEVAQRG